MMTLNTFGLVLFVTKITLLLSYKLKKHSFDEWRSLKDH